MTRLGIDGAREPEPDRLAERLRDDAIRHDAVVRDRRRSAPPRRP